ncbi:hypothetical protein [Leuconostoc pseudomesenteroides]|uniref:hypothetical protein n=1 Tax=Leuconostoc pseudomesenteroides TaxID=33968 RepID=UPI0039E89003
MINNDRYYRRHAVPESDGYVVIETGTLKRAIFNNQKELIYRFVAKLVEEAGMNDDTYRQESAYQPIIDIKYSELAQDYAERILIAQKMYGSPNSNAIIGEWIDLLKEIALETDVYHVFKAYLKLLKLVNNYLAFLGTNTTGFYSTMNFHGQLILVGHIDQCPELDSITLDHSQELKLPRLNNNQFLQLTSQCVNQERHNGVSLNLLEYIAVQIAFAMILQRGFTEASIVPWGNPGFRTIQTQASITDLGLGHITGTTSSMAYINGTNVHIEYLERGKVEDRELVEPYRLPNLATIGEVKLMTGNDTSVSSYVGRPMFEDSFDNSFIKTVHTMVGVVSAIFMNGLSECKIAIERMTVTQSIKFMKAIAANTLRDSNLQVLAAAFDINVPIIDDRVETIQKFGQAQVVEDKMAIARLGIEITKSAGFEKVTFDGTANSYPSVPIMEQLGYQNSLSLVHKAHESGLLTYFSAGFRFKHLPDIVLTGTDGIGLGGAQILRFMDKRNGYQGPFKKSHVTKILNINRKTASSVLGQGAQLLVRLDQMHFEQSLPLEYEPKRMDLFNAMFKKDEASVKVIINYCDEIVILPMDLNHPLAETVHRMVMYADRNKAFKNVPENEVIELEEQINQALDCSDYDTVRYLVNQIKNEEK